MNALTPTEIAILEAISRPYEVRGWIDRARYASFRSLPPDKADDAIRSMVEKGLLTPRLAPGGPLPDDSPDSRARFELTSRGREVLAEEGPLPPPEGWPGGRAYCGMLRGLIPEIPFEVFKENRREMAGEYDKGWTDE